MGRHKKIAFPGDKFGHLTVLSEYEPTEKGNRRVLCECDCEDKNQRIVAVSDLSKGTVDCCYSCVIKRNREKKIDNLKDEIGKQYGRLIIQYFFYDDNYNTALLMAHCICTCEKHNEVDVIYQNLKSGTTSSCGCYRSELTIDYNHNMPYEQRHKVRKHNQYDLTGEYGIGYFENGMSFMFDIEDFEKVDQYYWMPHLTTNGKGYYATTYRDNKIIPLHQIILGKEYLQGNQYVADHIDRNTLNNRKNNLRIATYSQNAQNRSLQSNNISGVTGVTYDKICNKWKAQIGHLNKWYVIGEYDLFEDAVKARLEKENELFKEFAPQKHLFQQYGIE